jgi:pyridoxal phosphate enzyme (YggS family)
MVIETNLISVKQQIAKLSQAIPREPETITLVLVSKTRSAQEIRAAHQAGQTHFAENYLQEALPKIQTLKELGLVWHFIGAIQNNKTKPLAEHFDWVQSVDQIKTIQRLAAQRPLHLPPLNVCLQVNIDDEASKSGAPADRILYLAQAVLAYPKQLRLRGLMTIPKANQSEVQSKASFLAMHGLYSKLQAEGIPLDTLSMGMSQDFTLAIECGSTMVRLGTAIFGKRRSV